MNTIIFCVTILCGNIKPCENIYLDYCKPPIKEIPLHVTNYWTYYPDGSKMTGWNGQCNADCSTTGNGTVLTDEWIGKTGACIKAWTGLYYTTVIVTPYFRHVCNDNFGNVTYQDIFYHATRGHWVIPVDRWQPRSSYDVVFDWYLKSVTVDWIER